MAKLLMKFFAQFSGLVLPHPFGVEDNIYSLALAGVQVHSQEITLATASNAILYDSNDIAAPFTAALILSDKDLSVELQGTTAADNSNFKIAAGVPFILSSGSTRAYNAAGAFAGALQNITKVTVRNDSGAQATIAYTFPK